MTKRPLITVVVPVFNSGQYVSKCIESILSQSFTDFELVLVDDGSIDNSYEICASYVSKDERVRLYQQPNKGVTVARSVGVGNAKGEFICFVDSDDQLDVRGLEHLARYAKPNIDIVISGASMNSIISGETFVKLTLESKLINSVCARLYRTRILSKDVFAAPRSLTIGEDAIMNIRVGLAVEGDIQCFTDVIYHYTYNPTSVTRNMKLTLSYEEFYISQVIAALGEKKQLYYDSLQRSNMKTLENLIVGRITVPYSHEWVKELTVWGRMQNLSLRQWILLNIKCNLIAKYLLAIDKRLSMVLGIYGKV